MSYFYEKKKLQNMNKILAVIAMILIGSTVSNAQTQKTNQQPVTPLATTSNGSNAQPVASKSAPNADATKKRTPVKSASTHTKQAK